MEKVINDFAGLLYEALPFIVLGAVVAGVIEELVPRELVARLIPRNPLLAIAIGGLLGLLMPLCECAIIPIVRRLIRKGVPLSACVCYLLAGPIINPIVMWSTYLAFQIYDNPPENVTSTFKQLGAWEALVLRIGLGYLVAVTTSLIVELQYRKWGNKLLAPLAMPSEVEPEPLVSAGWFASLRDYLKMFTFMLWIFVVQVVIFPIRFASSSDFRRRTCRSVANITETALHDFVEVSVFLIMGAALAAFSRLFLSHDQIDSLSQQYPPMLIGVVTVGLMAFLAITLCICSEADAFFAASFFNLPAGAKMAFLILGPMLDIKLYLMYRRVFRPRLIWTIIISAVVQVFIYTLIIHFVLEDLPRFWENTYP